MFVVNQNTEKLVLSETPVIRAEQFERYRLTEEMFSQLVADKERISENADTYYTDAKQRGYEEGFLAGKEAAAEEVNATLTKMVEQLTQFYHRREQETVDLVQAVLHKISGEYLDSRMVSNVVRHTFESFDNGPVLAVECNPDDANMIASEMTILSVNTEVVPNPERKPGTCIFHFEAGSVDASVETQVEAAIDILRNTNSTY